MSLFEIKIRYEDKDLVKAKADRIENFDKIFDELKHKFNGKK